MVVWCWCGGNVRKLFEVSRTGEAKLLWHEKDITACLPAIHVEGLAAIIGTRRTRVVCPALGRECIQPALMIPFWRGDVLFERSFRREERVVWDGGEWVRDVREHRERVHGAGVSGEGVSGEGVSGEGVSGEGVSGEGVSGEGVSGEGVSGDRDAADASGSSSSAHTTPTKAGDEVEEEKGHAEASPRSVGRGGIGAEAEAEAAVGADARGAATGGGGQDASAAAHPAWKRARKERDP
jgi:hypothetical protein